MVNVIFQRRMVVIEKYYEIAVNEKINKYDIKKMLETSNMTAFNAVIQSLSKQRTWIYKTKDNLKKGDIVELPFGTSDITHYGCVIGKTDISQLDSNQKYKKIYNKVEKLSLRPIM